VQSGGYTASLECLWELSCSDPAKSPQLDFTKFDTEGNFDFVTLDDPVAEFHGTDLPNVQTALGNTMTVTFTSDAGQHADGFDALFSCVVAPCGLADVVSITQNSWSALSRGCLSCLGSAASSTSCYPPSASVETTHSAYDVNFAETYLSVRRFDNCLSRPD
jgi:hypothetical protein